jgi:hypothetical protein
MQRVYSYFERGSLRLRVKKSRADKETFVLAPGKKVIIEGGPGSGKEKFLQQTVQHLTKQGINYVRLDCDTPKSQWLAEYKLPVKVTNTDRRLREIIERSLPDNFYLILENAQSISASKLDTVFRLNNKARSLIVTTNHFNELNKSLRAQLFQAKLITLGVGADTFDCTMIIMACIVVSLALLGYNDLVFTVAAIRYLFQGMRMGGKPI